MRLTIVTRRERVTKTNHHVSFSSVACPGAGYSFDCTEDGAITGDEYRTAEQRQAQIQELIKDPGYLGPFRTTSTHSYVEPGVGRCECGCEVVLSDALDNECERCHRWYNMSGQEVTNPHSAWGRAMREEDDRFAD